MWDEYGDSLREAGDGAAKTIAFPEGHWERREKGRFLLTCKPIRPASQDGTGAGPAPATYCGEAATESRGQVRFQTRTRDGLWE